MVIFQGSLLFLFCLLPVVSFRQTATTISVIPPCPRETDGLRSSSGSDDGKVSPLRFFNSAQQSFDYFWVTADGQEVRLGQLADGASIALDTTLGHAFRVRDGQGKLQLEHTVASPNDELVVRECMFADTIDAASLVPGPSPYDWGQGQTQGVETESLPPCPTATPALRSSSRGGASTLEIFNGFDQDAGTFWVDFKGEEVPTDKATDRNTINTYVGHAFRIRDGEGRLIHEHLVASPADNMDVKPCTPYV
ncbi:unnamed protein product [Polarella glacialis]|uniref:Uncharacterized protein n=1 Tax=Polarella glacialis TaxID=89957 RepID=A0A813F0Y7_POLGL|nr:unnamed protein product [Polarella glacialis]CAE8687362.1 unnamed protein product [Polarella glacialis]